MATPADRAASSPAAVKAAHLEFRAHQELLQIVVQQLGDAPPFALFREGQLAGQGPQLGCPGLDLQVGVLELLGALGDALFELLVGALQRLVGAPFGGDVMEDEHCAGDLPVTGKDRRRAVLDRDSSGRPGPREPCDWPGPRHAFRAMLGR